MNGEILEHNAQFFFGGGMLLETSRGVLACVGLQRSSHDLVFLAQVLI